MVVILVVAVVVLVVVVAAFAAAIAIAVVVAACVARGYVSCSRSSRSCCVAALGRRSSLGRRRLLRCVVDGTKPTRSKRALIVLRH